MGHFEKTSFPLIYFAVIFIAFIFVDVSADDRCKDESFCRAYCLSTNPDTVNARCGRDLASCICITPDNHSVKVRFIEERNPVPPTPSTTPRPSHGVQYVNSQPTQSLPQYNYNGNGNSIAGSKNNQQQQQQGPQESQMTPVLLECDASEMSTRMCHLFCTMEIRAWYGMCNITSKACACFGIPLSAVQQEPIAAIFHSTAPVTPAPAPSTPKPTYSPPRPGYQQFYPPQQYLQQQPQQQQQQQQWRPIQPTNYQTLYNNNQYYPASSPTLLNAVASQTNQHHEHGPVRSAASLFGHNGQPISSSISTPDGSLDTTLRSPTLPASSNEPAGEQNTSGVNTGAEAQGIENSESSATHMKPTRKRRSLNMTADMKGKSKDRSSGKDLSSQGECSKYKCAISCKRNNYLAPDCEPKCIDGQCWCECFPRL